MGNDSEVTLIKRIRSIILFILLSILHILSIVQLHSYSKYQPVPRVHLIMKPGLLVASPTLIPGISYGNKKSLKKKVRNNLIRYSFTSKYKHKCPSLLPVKIFVHRDLLISCSRLRRQWATSLDDPATQRQAMIAVYETNGAILRIFLWSICFGCDNRRHMLTGAERFLLTFRQTIMAVGNSLLNRLTDRKLIKNRLCDGM